VPWMIVPYMSIDLFFVAAPFICSDRRELSILSRRIALAILVAGAFFLIMPLRFTFQRPPVNGILGIVFEWFRGMDRPFNQFPSLHIALRTILAALYARHARGWKYIASNVWFSLIGFSTVLTYQHHVVDVIGGFGLAGLCFYLVSETSWRSPVTRHPRIGFIYWTGAVILILAAFLMRPAGAILLWPALSLAIVGAAYFGIGPAIFRKRDGRLPFSTWLLLAPVILGQRLSLPRYKRRSNPWDVITDEVWVGRLLAESEAAAALSQGVTAILDLTCELPECRTFAQHANYRNLPIMDLTAPTPAQFAEALAFINRHTRAGGIVYVHCKAGYSRSAAIVAAYLLHSEQVADVNSALQYLKKRRAGIVIRQEVLQVLEKPMELAKAERAALV